MRSMPPLLLLILLVCSAAAERISIDWIIRDYPGMSAMVGDEIVFAYTNSHNVFVYPSGDCTEDGSTEVPGVEIDDDFNMVASYTVTEADIGTKTFVCKIAGHCAAGQILTFEVAATGDNSTPPSTPSPTTGGSGSDGDSTTPPPTTQTPAETEGDGFGTSTGTRNRSVTSALGMLIAAFLF